MNEKQKRFADYYIETLNAKQAAIKAGYSEKTAEVQGSRLLSNAKVKEYIQERLNSKEKDRVASQDEVLEFLTDVMRGEVKDQLGLETPVKERNKAAELLGKRYSLFIDKVESKVEAHNTNYNIDADIDLFRSKATPDEMAQADKLSWEQIQEIMRR